MSASRSRSSDVPLQHNIHMPVILASDMGNEASTETKDGTIPQLIRQLCSRGFPIRQQLASVGVSNRQQPLLDCVISTLYLVETGEPQ